MTTQADEMLKESNEIANDIEHTNNQLRKRFDAASANKCEEREKKEESQKAKGIGKEEKEYCCSQMYSGHG